MTHNKDYRDAMFMALNKNPDIYDMVKKELCSLHVSDLPKSNLYHTIKSRGLNTKEINQYCKNTFYRSLSSLKKEQLIDVINRFDIPYNNLDEINNSLRKKKCICKINKNKITYHPDFISFSIEIDDGILQTFYRNHIYKNYKIEFIVPNDLMVTNISLNEINVISIVDFIEKIM